MSATTFVRSLSTGGKLPPVLLLLGDDTALRDTALRAVEQNAVEPSMRDFNLERFTAGECQADSIVAACRMVPMMAPKRLVLVRSLERWESDHATSNLDTLAEYAKAPVDSCCLVLLADHLNGSRRLVLQAKKEGWLVACSALSPEELVPELARMAGERGKNLPAALARKLVDRAGTDLATLEDAVERMSLFAGEAQELNDAHLVACVSRLRHGDTWDLVDAVGKRNPEATLRAFADSFEPKDRGLPMVGALAWSLRQLLRVHEGVQSGLAPEAAARAAGAYTPQKARELAAAAKRFRKAELVEFLTVLAGVDRELKGAKRPPRTILEAALLRFSASRP